MTEVVGERHYDHNVLINPYLEQPEVSFDSTENAVRAVCGVSPVSFHKLMKYIETLNNSDDNAPPEAIFASELLSYYRPKGRLALISPFLHVSLIIACCVPTLALFTLWALNQFSYYYFTITQTSAFALLVVCFYL